jgi:hypothetical protein
MSPRVQEGLEYDFPVRWAGLEEPARPVEDGPQEFVMINPWNMSREPSIDQELFEEEVTPVPKDSVSEDMSLCDLGRIPFVDQPVNNLDDDTPDDSERPEDSVWEDLSLYDSRTISFVDHIVNIPDDDTPQHAGFSFCTDYDGFKMRNGRRRRDEVSGEERRQANQPSRRDDKFSTPKSMDMREPAAGSTPLMNERLCELVDELLAERGKNPHPNPP